MFVEQIPWVKFSLFRTLLLVDADAFDLQRTWDETDVTPFFHQATNPPVVIKFLSLITQKSPWCIFIIVKTPFPQNLTKPKVKAIHNLKYIKYYKNCNWKTNLGYFKFADILSAINCISRPCYICVQVCFSQRICNAWCILSVLWYGFYWLRSLIIIHSTVIIISSSFSSVYHGYMFKYILL